MLKLKNITKQITVQNFIQIQATMSLKEGGQTKPFLKCAISLPHELNNLQKNINFIGILSNATSDITFCFNNPGIF